MTTPPTEGPHMTAAQWITRLRKSYPLTGNEQVQLANAIEALAAEMAAFRAYADQTDYDMELTNRLSTDIDTARDATDALGLLGDSR